MARAVERGELEVVFQPDVTLADGRLTGIEALVRWRRPRGFAAATDTFVQLAEEVGAVQAVDAWVMEESLRALCRWRGQPGGDELELGLNVSALSLTPRLPDDLADCCARNGVPPGRVRIEVTETALADEHLARTVLAADGHKPWLLLVFLETTQPLSVNEFQTAIQYGKLPTGKIHEVIEQLDISFKGIAYFGSLVTKRAEFPYKIGILVLDHSFYLNNEDYEVEYEVEDFQLGQLEFQELLKKYGIPIRKTQNKIARFYQQKHSS